jgi:hypothetical protein
MSEVVIAPCRLLGQKNTNQTATISMQPDLPLGDSFATVTQRLDDTVYDSLSRGPYVTDAKERNAQVFNEEVRPNVRSLVGKHSNVVPPFNHDLSAMRKVNDKMTEMAEAIEVKAERELRYNLVWGPGTTNDTFNPWNI